MCMYAIKLTIKFDKLQHKIKPVTMVCCDLSKSKRIKKKILPTNIHLSLCK